jgi:hypothetical protein
MREQPLLVKKLFSIHRGAMFPWFFNKEINFLAGKSPVAFAVNEFATLVEDEVCWHGGQSTAKK